VQTYVLHFFIFLLPSLGGKREGRKEKKQIGEGGRVNSSTILQKAKKGEGESRSTYNFGKK